MSSSVHSRKSSQETRGASYQHILEHVLQYPGTYEIPLRTMYAINASPYEQMHAAQKTGEKPVVRSPQSKKQAQSPTREATARFTSSLIDQISNLPSQPNTLPTVYMSSYLRNCFPTELELVDFPKALTALDYLKDLETRRRREVDAAMTRLGSWRGVGGTPKAVPSGEDATIDFWEYAIKESGKKAEQYYTKLFLSLRRWILINEYSLEPFNKARCMAMLNTLFPFDPPPPTMTTLTQENLRAQRDGYFRYITAVEKRGRAVLNPIMQQGKREKEETGWPAVRSDLDHYLRIAKSVIDDCSQMNGIEYFHSGGTREPNSSTRKTKRANDSGRHGSIGRLETTPFEALNNNSRSQPQSPIKDDGKSLSTIEKIARELRRIRTKNRFEHETRESLGSPIMDNGDNDGREGEEARRFFKRLRGGSNNMKSPRNRSESAMSFRSSENNSAQQSRMPSLDSQLYRKRFLSNSNADTTRL